MGAAQPTPYRVGPAAPAALRVCRRAADRRRARRIPRARRDSPTLSGECRPGAPARAPGRGRELRKKRQYVVADRHPAKRPVVVHGITEHVEPERGTEILGVGTPERQQRADHAPVTRGHAREPRRRRAAQHVQQHRFGLVVGGVADEDDVGTDRVAGPLQGVIAGVAGPSFEVRPAPPRGHASLGTRRRGAQRARRPRPLRGRCRRASRDRRAPRRAGVPRRSPTPATRGSRRHRNSPRRRERQSPERRLRTVLATRAAPSTACAVEVALTSDRRPGRASRSGG